MPMQMPPVKYDIFQLAGGLDLVTPVLNLKPGVLRGAVNFECAVTGGYSRIQGYERYDGRTSPSTAIYTIIAVSLTGSVAIGDTINGESSGATATVIALDTGKIVFTKLVGVFVVGENVRVSSTVIGSITNIDGTSTSPVTAAAYMALAANNYRNDISAPVGEGPIRGVVMYGGTVYAFRDNIGATACNLWKSSPTGWVLISMVYEVSFTDGDVAVPADGATLTQGGVTATVHRVMTRTGTWAGTAVGRLVISQPSGGTTNFSAGAATLTGGATVTLSGPQTQVSLLPGGHFEFSISNFGGSRGSDRVYGADGVNRGFEFDGDYLCPIETGMLTDAPNHVIAHKNYLFFSFGGSVQWSSLGSPYAWSVILGAGEFSAGETVTNFVTLPGSQQGGALLVQTRNNTLVLYGSSNADWNLVSYNVGVGALPYTAQNISGVYSLDDRGVVGLNATLNYGNFDQTSLTSTIRPFIVEHRQRAQASCVNREKSQYRVFFNDGWGLYSTIVNDKYLGSIPIFFPDPVFCAWDGEDGNGNVVSFVGSTNGYVHQLERGTSFDGEPITSSLTLNYNTMRGPRVLKRFRKASAEIVGNSYAEVGVSYVLGYGKSDYPAPATTSYSSNFTTATWDAGTAWDGGLVWDGATLIPSEIELQGTAENIALNFANSSDYTDAFTIYSVIIHYSNRRGLR